MRRIPVVFWVVLSSGCAMLPPPGKPLMPDFQFTMREFRLANGMRIIVEEDHSSPLVGVFTTVGVGSSGDPVGKEGLAHLIEHLAFRAKPGGRLTGWNQLEGGGAGFFNAYTNLDNTTYMEVASKELLPKLLTLEAGRLLNPMVGVDEKVFEVEREVVRNELRQRGENSIGPAFSYLQEAVFPGDHPYSRPTTGTHESLSNTRFEDAKAFAKEHYKPSNLTMLIVGDVDLDTVHNTLMRALPMAVFQPLPPTRDPYPSRMRDGVKEPPAPPPTKLIYRNATVASPELYVVWSLPRSFGSDAVMLSFVTAAARRELTGAFFSDPNIVNVSVFPVPGLESSMLVVRATLRKADLVERSYERVLDQFVKLWAFGDRGVSEAGMQHVQEWAFGRMRNQVMMSETFAAEDISTRGANRVDATHFTGDPLTFTRMLKSLAAVTPSQISYFAEKYLQRSRARAVLVEPFPDDAKGKDNGPVGLTPTEAESAPMSFPSEAVLQLGRPFSARAKFETVVTSKRQDIVEVLPNGLKVVIHKRKSLLPVVAMKLTFPVGSAGTLPKGAAVLGDRIASPRGHLNGYGGHYGIEWYSNIEADRSVVTSSGATGNLPNMLAQMVEQVTTMHVEDLELDNFKRHFLDYSESIEHLPQLMGTRSLDAALFNGHALGEHSMTADFKKLSAGDINDWFTRAWSPDKAVLVVTGDLDAEATLGLVKTWMSPWRPATQPFPSLARPRLSTTPQLKVVVTHQPGATQAQVHLACLVDAASTERDLGNRTMVDVLSSHLFTKVRGELGASYGFGGRASPLLGGLQRLDWSGSIENSRLAAALAVVSSSLKTFETETVTENAVERARWAIARSLTMYDSTSLGLAEVLTEQVLMGRDLQQVDTVFETLAGVGRAQVLEGWAQCRGSLVVSFVGDEASIREAIKKADF